MSDNPETSKIPETPQSAENPTSPESTPQGPQEAPQPKLKGWQVAQIRRKERAAAEGRLIISKPRKPKKYIYRKKPGEGISPLRRLQVKAGLLAGKTAKQALKDAGYKESVANHSTSAPCVKLCQAEIEKDIKSKITVDYVLSEIKRIQIAAEAKNDFSTALRAQELLGKHLAIFTDRIESHNINEEKRAELDSYYNRIKQGIALSQ